MKVPKVTSVDLILFLMMSLVPNRMGKSLSGRGERKYNFFCKGSTFKFFAKKMLKAIFHNVFSQIVGYTFNFLVNYNLSDEISISINSLRTYDLLRILSF